MIWRGKKTSDLKTTTRLKTIVSFELVDSRVAQRAASLEGYEIEFGLMWHIPQNVALVVFVGGSAVATAKSPPEHVEHIGLQGHLLLFLFSRAAATAMAAAAATATTGLGFCGVGGGHSVLGFPLHRSQDPRMTVTAIVDGRHYGAPRHRKLSAVDHVLGLVQQPRRERCGRSASQRRRAAAALTVHCCDRCFVWYFLHVEPFGKTQFRQKRKPGFYRNNRRYLPLFIYVQTNLTNALE